MPVTTRAVRMISKKWVSCVLIPNCMHFRSNCCVFRPEAFRYSPKNPKPLWKNPLICPVNHYGQDYHDSIIQAGNLLDNFLRTSRGKKGHAQPSKICERKPNHIKWSILLWHNKIKFPTLPNQSYPKSIKRLSNYPL